MIEVGKIYKLKKLNVPFIHDETSDYKVLSRLNDNTVVCQNMTNGERCVFLDDCLTEDPNEQIGWEITQAHNVLEDLLTEEAGCAAACASAACATSTASGPVLGVTPTPALGHVSGAMVNGVPVEGKSVKKKKKKKNEATFSGIVVEQDEIHNFDFNQVKKYFQQYIQQDNIYINILKDNVKIVGKTWTETQSHIGKSPFFLLFKQLDFLLMTSKGDGELVKNTKLRKDNIAGWYYLYNTALFGQDLIQIKLDIAQDIQGKKIYFLRKIKQEAISSSPSNECCHVGRNMTSNNIILEDTKNVNDLEIGKEYDLTPYFHITILKKGINEDVELDAGLIQATDTQDEVRALIVKANAEENEAITSYLEKAKKAEELGVPVLAKLFRELADDETVHTGCLQGALSKLQLDDIEHVIEGDAEAQEIMEDLEDDVIEFLDGTLEPVSTFKEKYEEITNLIAKQLDRMNFEFANTEDIIYKKEGSHKYLLKFDNEEGYLKFKVSKDNNVIIDKEWKLEEGEDISPIFNEIENIYKEYGI